MSDISTIRKEIAQYIHDNPDEIARARLASPNPDLSDEEIAAMMYFKKQFILLTTRHNDDQIDLQTLYDKVMIAIRCDLADEAADKKRDQQP